MLSINILLVLTRTSSTLKSSDERENPYLIPDVSAKASNFSLLNKAMDCLTTFWSMTDCINNNGSIRLECHIRTVPFLYLGMFRYTNTYHYVTIAYSIQYSNIQNKLVT